MAELGGAEEKPGIHCTQVRVGQESGEKVWREGGGVVRVNKCRGASPNEVDTDEENDQKCQEEKGHSFQCVVHTVGKSV